jgi:hypothetical protein
MISFHFKKLITQSGFRLFVFEIARRKKYQRKQYRGYDEYENAVYQVFEKFDTAEIQNFTAYF